MCGSNKRWGKTFNEATISLSFYFLSLSVSIRISCIWNCAVVLSPWHSPLAHSPGPPCGMLYSVRPMEEGHPGTQREHTHTHTHTLARSPTHANTHTRRQIQLLRAITTLWQTSKSKTSGVGRPPFREKEKKKKKSNIFHVCCVKLWR